MKLMKEVDELEVAFFDEWFDDRSGFPRSLGIIKTMEIVIKSIK